MARLSRVQDRIASLVQLLEVISAMRSMAAARMQQAVDALGAASRYAKMVADSMRQVSPTPRSSGGRCQLTLLIGSEHGFVGAYNEALLQQARSGPNTRTLVVGSRIAFFAEEQGLPVLWRTPMTTQAAGIAPLAGRLAKELTTRMIVEEGVALIFGQWQGATKWDVHQCSFARSPMTVIEGTAPTHYLPLDVLQSRLFEEALFAELALAAANSLASENAARFRAMTSAHENIERKLVGLRADERILRQEQITDELLDVVSGAEVALSEQP